MLSKLQVINPEAAVTFSEILNRFSIFRANVFTDHSFNGATAVTLDPFGDPYQGFEIGGTFAGHIVAGYHWPIGILNAHVGASYHFKDRSPGVYFGVGVKF